MRTAHKLLLILNNGASGDLTFLSTSYPSVTNAPVLGLFLSIDNLNFSSFGTHSYFALYDGAKSLANIEYGIDIRTGGALDIIENGAVVATVAETLSTATNYDFVIALDTSLNAHYFLRADLDDWQRIWVGAFASAASTVNADEDNTGGSYTAISKNFGTGLDIEEPTVDMAGALSVNDGSVSGGDPEQPDGDFVLQFIFDTKPSAVAVKIRFRYVDSDETWQLRLNSGGDYQLWEFTPDDAGLQRGSANGVLSGGELITVVIRGNTITAFYDATKAWTYTSANTYLRFTDWTIENLGTGGVITDMHQWFAYARTDDSRGAELVTNGAFTTDTDWTKGTGWTIGSGVASCDGTQAGNSDLEQAGVLTSGMYTEITYTISNYSAGNLSIVGGAIVTELESANGTYTVGIIPDGTTLKLRADVDFVGDIDNVSAKEIVFADDATAALLEEAVA